MSAMMGRGPVAMGVLSALSALSLLATAACADPGTADYAALCATKAEPITRVEDDRCPPLGEDDPRSPHGWYYQQLPATQYDEDGYGYYPIISVINVGSPVPAGSGSYSRPSGFSVARTLRPPTVSTPSTSGISRGGLGVSGGGASSGG